MIHRSALGRIEREGQGYSGRDPNTASPGAGGGIFLPRKEEALVTAQLRTNHHLEVREQAVVEGNSDARSPVDQCADGRNSLNAADEICSVR